MALYDSIYLGAGLSAHLHALKNSKERDNILMIDTINRHEYRHSWCFWKSSDIIPSKLIENQWPLWYLKNKNITVEVQSQEMPYCLVWSDRVLRHLAGAISSRCTWNFEETVQHYHDGTVVTNKGTYKANNVFDTRLSWDDFSDETLIQDFCEFHIQFSSVNWKYRGVTLMDFLERTGEIAFCYILPMTPSEIILTTTFFGTGKYKKSTHEKILTDYLKYQHHIEPEQYVIDRAIKGSLPMGFLKSDNNKLGVAGGGIRASTGYAFLNQFKQAHQLMSSKSSQLDRLMDELFLRLMKAEPELMPNIFLQLFQTNTPEKVVRFLQSDGGIFDHLHVVSLLPKLTFLRRGIFDCFSILKQ
ncbi:MAG: lycopene cyclase family protein [Chlamydiota bacterium]